jgi:hypothetical protein
VSGKGDAPRNCHSEAYRANYDAIFRAKPKKPKKPRHKKPVLK